MAKKVYLSMYSTNQVSEVYEMNNIDFDQRIQAVCDTRDNRIGLIESRLKDLTGLRISKEKDYQYPFKCNEDETPIKRNGKETIVIFPTNHIEKERRTHNQYDVWTYILGKIDSGHVFTKPHDSAHEELKDDDAKNQLEAIRAEILRYNGEDSRISDVLGVFAYREHVIKLYAQVIAWHSINDGVDTEDLTFVVLTHELAHAYTMAGYDIDGNRGNLLNTPFGWHTDVVKGLAQYYTEAICYQLGKEYPKFEVAFDALLNRQTSPYTWHKYWFGGLKAHETVRSMMMSYRFNPDYGVFRGGLGLSAAILNSIP